MCVPIGIVTRDRVSYLNTTLRSLSASVLPTGVPVYVFDDASVTTNAQRYYETDSVIPESATWPTTLDWQRAGLGFLGQDTQPIRGIHKKVNVVRLHAESVGVVAHSCSAIRYLFQRFPQAPGVFLLQDDVVFNADWYTRMLATAEHVQQTEKLPLGLLAGLKLNMVFPEVWQDNVAAPSGITAQCLYVTRAAYRNTKFFRMADTAHQRRFDDLARRSVAREGFWAGTAVPFVCQHIGVQSQVRPERTWESRPAGRIGYYAHPPYAFADAVRDFCSDSLDLQKDAA